MANSIVCIFRKGSECSVVPGDLIVTKGDKVTFQAIDLHVRLFFPEFRTETAERAWQVIEVSRGHDQELDTRDFLPGVYPYAVFCLQAGVSRDHILHKSFAKGGSDPIIIIRGRQNGDQNTEDVV